MTSLLGQVTIRRRRGRIAGFGSPRIPVQILWCGTNRPRKKFGQRRNGWSFPPAVREFLLQHTKGRTVLHLFGGRADFGIRLDIDPSTRPDVIGDAWLPPFAKNSFDVVILDPPYFELKQQEKIALIRAAAWIARREVIWFHTTWIATDTRTPLEKAFLIRVGDQCAVRCLQIFRVKSSKLPPVEKFTRGPAVKYNRWLIQEQGLLPLAPATESILPAGKKVAIGKSQRDLAKRTRQDSIRRVVGGTVIPEHHRISNSLEQGKSSNRVMASAAPKSEQRVSDRFHDSRLYTARRKPSQGC